MPEENTSKLELYREWVVDRLRHLPTFKALKKEGGAHAPVYSRKTADFLNILDRSLTALGVGLVVHIPEATPKAIQSRSVLLDPVRLTVTVLENVLINQSATGTGYGALFLAERVQQALQMQQPEIEGAGALIPLSPGITQVNVVADLDREEMEDLYSIDVNFTFRCQLDDFDEEEDEEP